MRNEFRSTCAGIVVSALLASPAVASQDSVGPNGINSASLSGADGQPLTGAGVGIGQVDIQRPGDVDVGDDLDHRNTTVDPEAVYERDQPNPPPANPPANSNPINIEGSHAEWVAGVMISSDPSSTGVAPEALLYAAGYKPADLNNLDPEVAITAQLIASLTTPTGGHVHAINMSIAVKLQPENQLDGNQLLTQFVDWSAADDDVLYVQAGRDFNTPAGRSVPIDNFNGMVVGASEKVGNIYRQVSDVNGFSETIVGSDPGPRTAISLIAPGEDIEMRGLGNILASDAANDGTSYAAPHVTGTVALLQQFATQKIDAPGSTWNAAHSRRHEVMKAVLMNSADKIKDDGMTLVNGKLVPEGGFLGMERTVLDRGPNHDGLNGRNWLESEAYGDDPFSDASFTPLDDEMGAGHLNAKRALQQFENGEFGSDASAVPVIGWDYGHASGTSDLNKYAIAQPLLGESFISITMAWDRGVAFDIDGGTPGEYDVGDTFESFTKFPPNALADDVINDLDLYLLPAGSTDTSEAIAASLSNDSTIEHLFFQIPATGQYEIWVEQFDSDLGDGQDYAIAWWAAAAASGTTQGDFDGNGTVGPEDYALWKTNFGTSSAQADGNGDGIVDAADYTVWRDHLGEMLGSGSLASVPEPSAICLVLAGVLICVGRFRRSEPAKQHHC
jgi:Subtilase family